DADKFGGGVQHRKTGDSRDDQRNAHEGRWRAAHWMRSSSRFQTGVRSPGRKGRVPRSVWLSSGLWKSLPRDAARPNSLAVSAYFTYSCVVWLPVTTSTPRPPWDTNSVNSAYSSLVVNL